VPALALGHEQVRGERERAAERCRDADRAERDSLPELDDEREPRDAQGDGHPDPAPDVLLVDEAREERDEERGGELDEQRDADGELLDGDEVQPLDEGDADEPEGDEEEELAPADVIVAATGVTNGDLLRGVRYLADSARTQSLVMCTRCNWVRFVDGIHFFARERREEIRLLG